MASVDTRRPWDGWRPLTGLVARNVTRSAIVAERTETGASLWAKFMGLMGRPSLDADAALWLPESNGIHMMFMRFPIDALFLGRPDADGLRRVVGLRRGLRPWVGVVWWVRGAHGVLELPVGAIERSGTAVGDLVALEAATGAG